LIHAYPVRSRNPPEAFPVWVIIDDNVSSYSKCSLAADVRTSPPHMSVTFTTPAPQSESQMGAFNDSRQPDALVTAESA
jgi:hypothetical protein